MSIYTFKNYLAENKIEDIEVLETTLPTRTAQEAADAHSVPVSNIVKSLLVKIENEYVLFLVPGDRRLDLEGLKTRFNTREVRMANADEVKEITGYSIGGVPPFGHTKKLKTYIEDGFDTATELVAAAGSGNSVFKVSYERLKCLAS